MARWLLTRLAVFVFIGGIAVAAFLPNQTLDICNNVRWLGCGAQNLHYMRVVLGIGAGLIAIVIWQIGRLTRR